MYTRKQIAELIVQSLQKHKTRLQEEFRNSKEEIGYFVLDDLLPEELTKKLYQSFPNLSNAVEKKSIREHKYIGYQMNEFDRLLEEAIYAFQERTVVEAIAGICEIENIEPDENLYAGGISMMKQDNFLNPHLDNSHDKDVDRWRVLNVLFYVTPDWKLEDGGNLELWPKGVKEAPITMTSSFNRLVVMATHQHSWHSVNQVVSDKVRCCVSNYYFSKEAPEMSKSFHVTSFRGRPEEKSKDVVLQVDSFLRNSLRKVFSKGIRKNKHEYKKKD